MIDAQLARQGATPEEVAAVVAAVERFLHDTAGPGAGEAAAAEPQRWARIGLFEGVGEDARAPSAWGDPHPWGEAHTK